MKAIDLCGTNKNWGEKLIQDLAPDLLIFKSGYGTQAAGGGDSQFSNNVKKAENYKIPYAIYHYSYAENVNHAHGDAERALNAAKQGKPKIIFIDVEERSIAEKVGKSGMTAIVKTFIEDCQRAGYVAGFYADANFTKNYIDNTKLPAGTVKWIAQWSSKQPTIQWDLWQYASVSDTYGDRDESYFTETGVISRLIATTPTPTPTPEPTPAPDVVIDILLGKYGNGVDRFNAIEKRFGEGSYLVYQNKVNEVLKLAEDIKDGKFGNGMARAKALRDKGQDPNFAQRVVNITIYGKEV